MNPIGEEKKASKIKAKPIEEAAEDIDFTNVLVEDLFED